MGVVLAGAFVLLVGCSRKAPGPEECRAFALKAYNIADRRQLDGQQVRSVVDALTTRCLTTPFDRELLQCVDAGGGTERCVEAFAERHAAGARE